MLYIKFKILEHFEKLIHGVSTRMGGYSEAPYSSLNLGFHVKDNPDKVLINREIFCSELGIALDCIVAAKQVHGGKVAVVKKQEWGKGSEDHESAIDSCDAMITDAKNIFLMVLLADCPGIVFFDPVKKAVGVAHAGWRSTLVGIAENTVLAMKTTFKSKPGDIVCAISPSIGPCCFEIKDDVAVQFNNECVEKRDGKLFLDLRELNKIQLINSGIKQENIEISDVCTFCNTKTYFSVRKEGETGRHAVIIGMKK